MATAALRNETPATIIASFTRLGGHLRVTFESPAEPGKGFTLSELGVLAGAIEHARRQMIQQDDEIAPTLSVARLDDDDDIERHYLTQLRQMNPVPT